MGHLRDHADHARAEAAHQDRPTRRASRRPPPRPACGRLRVLRRTQDRAGHPPPSRKCTSPLSPVIKPSPQSAQRTRGLGPWNRGEILASSCWPRTCAGHRRVVGSLVAAEKSRETIAKGAWRRSRSCAMPNGVRTFPRRAPRRAGSRWDSAQRRIVSGRWRSMRRVAQELAIPRRARVGAPTAVPHAGMGGWRSAIGGALDSETRANSEARSGRNAFSLRIGAAGEFSVPAEAEQWKARKRWAGDGDGRGHLSANWARSSRGCASPRRLGEKNPRSYCHVSGDTAKPLPDIQELYDGHRNRGRRACSRWSPARRGRVGSNSWVVDGAHKRGPQAGARQRSALDERPRSGTS